MSPRRHHSIAATAAMLAAMSTALSGCFLWTTRDEGERLKQKTERQQERIAELERGMREERKQLRSEVTQAEKKVAELEKVLEKATKVVTRNSADLGQEVGDLRQQIAKLKGKLAELRHEIDQVKRTLDEQHNDLEKKLETFARRAGVDVELEESEIPDDRQAHFEAAKKALSKGEHSRARALFREYVSRYPDDESTPEAQYRIGASYLQQERPASALGALRKILADHGESEFVDDTLLEMAEAFYRLNSCDDAEASLKALLHKHRRSPLRDSARKKLRKIRRDPEGYCTN